MRTSQHGEEDPQTNATSHSIDSGRRESGDSSSPVSASVLPVHTPYLYACKASATDSRLGFVGNVQVSNKHLALGRDTVVPEVLTEENVAPYRRVADAVHSSPPLSSPPKAGPVLLMQLCHGGRQSPRIVGGRSFFEKPLGASTVPMKSRSTSWIGKQLYALMFVPPKAVEDSEIEVVIESFVRGAELAVRAGVRPGIYVQRD